MAIIKKFNSILNSKSNNLDLLRLGEFKYYPYSRTLGPLKQDLAEFASKKDFFSFCTELQQELLSKTVSKENFIFKGAQGKVYRIPGTDCAIKIPLECKNVTGKEINTNVTVQDKVNYIIAKIGDDTQIMKYIDGKNTTQLLRKGIAVNKTILDMPHESFMSYIEKIVEASKVNMFHDFGGPNTLINTKYKYMIPIDFHSSLTRKANPIEDLFFQFGKQMQSSKEQDLLLAKSALAYVDLIKSGKITSKTIAKTDVSLFKVRDCFLPKNQEFFCEVESRLKKITGFKKLESISPDIGKSLDEEIRKFNEFIASKLLNT